MTCQEESWFRRSFLASETARALLWAHAVGHELDGVGGRYLEDCQEAIMLDPTIPFPGHGCMPYALDQDHAERLWSVSQDLVERGK